MPNTAPSRLIWPDLIRVFAAAGVVTIHSFELPLISLNELKPGNYLLYVWYIIVKTAVPLFLMLSGALLLGKNESDLVFLSKRIRRILIPWLFWTIIFLVVKYSSVLSSVDRTLSTLVRIFSAEFTYIPTIFSLYVLIPYLRVLVRGVSPLKQWLLIFFWFLTVSLLPHLRNSMAFPLQVDNGLVRLTINYLGYLFLGFEIRILLEKKVGLRKFWSLALFLLVAVVLGTLWLYVSGSSDSITSFSYTAPLMVLSSILLFYLFFILGNWLESMITIPSKNWGVRSLSSLSLGSFGVFFIHPLLIPLVKNFFPSENPSLWTRNFLLSWLIILLSFGSIQILRKIPGFRLLAN